MRNGLTLVELYLIGGVFLQADYNDDAKYQGLIFLARVDLSSPTKSLPPAHDIHPSVATYTVESAAGVAFFGLSFGGEVGSVTEVQDVSPGTFTPRWIACIFWPLSALCWLSVTLLRCEFAGQLCTR